MHEVTDRDLSFMTKKGSVDLSIPTSNDVFVLSPFLMGVLLSQTPGPAGTFAVHEHFTVIGCFVTLSLKVVLSSQVPISAQVQVSPCSVLHCLPPGNMKFGTDTS